MAFGLQQERWLLYRRGGGIDPSAREPGAGHPEVHNSGIMVMAGDGRDPWWLPSTSPMAGGAIMV